ncbi:MAG: TonB-dependent receptor [Balneolaceae bacterium]
MTFRYYRCLTFLLFLLFSTDTLLAQSGGRITGKVVDDQGEPLIGVQVFLAEISRGTVTAIDGFYSIIDVPAGTYSITYKFVGFADVRIDNAEVITGRTTNLDVIMREMVIEGEEIVITAERPIVQKDRTTTTAFVSAEQIEALPVRSVDEVLNLQAGVVEGHFRGGRLNEVSYVVNGVPINNPINNRPAFEVEANMVSNLEVITGVFNAEFGQATSGVVNITTKRAPRQWSFNIQTDVSAIASTRKLEFVNRTTGPGDALSINDFTSERISAMDAADFPSRAEISINTGGPIIEDRLGFNVSARYIDDKGRFLGRDLFRPSDFSGNREFLQSTIVNNPRDPDAWVIQSTGSGDFVSMSQSERFSVNPSLVWTATDKLTLDYNLFFQTSRFRNFDHFRQYVPEGRNWNYPDNATHILSARYFFNPNTFMNLSYSYQVDRFESRLFGPPVDDTFFDERIVPEDFSQQTGAFSLAIGGNDIFYARNRARIHRIIGSVTSQVNRRHQVKTGFQVSLQDINDTTIGIDVLSQNNFQPIRTQQAWRNQFIDINPMELSAYIQDKIELDFLIINAGLRFDYFDPDFEIPIDWAQANLEMIPDPNNPGGMIRNRRSTDIKTQLSPRLGVAFPFSDRSVIRFSYGRFFQVPDYAQLYQNPNFTINPLADVTRFGNPNVDPQSTSTFEVGYQQGITDALGLELTLYTRDIRNLLADEIERDVASTNFSVRFVNREFGTVRGISLSLFQRMVRNIAWTVDYTLQFADGSFALTGDLFERTESGLEETLTLARLDWDRRHVLNNTFTWRTNEFLTTTFINTFTTGRPFTTEVNNIRSFIRNNEDRPPGFNTDVRMFYTPFPNQWDISVFFQVDNLFDIQTENVVYADTGSAFLTRELIAARRLDVAGVNTPEDFFIRQDFFNAPRIVSIGVKVTL